MHRRRKKRDQGEVEMNLAAMLDMAFQLLTFFILTFRPAPIEGQLAVHMPAERRELPPAAPEQDKNKLDPFPDIEDFRTLHIQVTAGPTGDVRQVSVERSDSIKGPLDASGVKALDQKLQSTFAAQDIPFDRAQIAVDGHLRYGELMKVIDVCSRQKRADGELVKKISFTEL